MTNLILNGSFVDHADGWLPTPHGQQPSLAFAPGASRDGTSGSLAVEHASALAQASVNYRPGGMPLLAIGDLTTVDAVAYVRYATGASGSPELSLTFYEDARAWSQAGATATASEPADDAAWTAVAIRDQAVPVGATHVGIAVNFGTGTFTGYLDDAYFGAPAGDAAPYAAAANPFLPNRLVNPDFEAGIDDWYDYSGGIATLEHDAVAPIAGTGSLKVTVTDADVGGGPASQESGSPSYIAVVDGETLALSFEIKGDVGAKMLAYIDYFGAADIEPWSGTLDGTVQTITQEIVVPNGAKWIKALAIVTDWNEDPQAVVFWLDDVSLGTPQEAEDETPPVITVPDPITALAANNEDTAVVTFTVTAEDDTDGPIDAVCDYESGDAFPLGETVVTCTATDEAENEAEETFTVTVIRAEATAVHGRDTIPPGLAERDIPGRVSGIGGIAPSPRPRPRRIRR